MKKKLLRSMAALLAVLMLVPAFAGCKRNEGEGPEDPNASGFVYVPEYIEVPSEIQDMSNVRLSGEKLYFTSYAMTDAATGAYGNALYSMNLDGTGLTKLEAYAPPAKPEGLEGDVNISAMCVDGEGNLWVAENGYFYHFELPEGFDPTTDDQWAYYVDDGSQMTLRKLDATGAEVLSVDLTPLSQNADPEMGGFYIGSMQVDDAGNIFISDGNATIHILKPDGSIQGKVESENWIDSLVRLSDGSVAASGYMENGYALKKIDVVAKAWGEEIALPYNVYNVYAGGGDYTCTYGDGNNLYGLDTATGEQVKLLNWINCDVNSDGLGNISVLPDGRIFCTVSTWNDAGSQYEMILLTKQDAASVTEKTVLTMATLYLDYNLRGAIIEFNKTNPDFRIQVNDYSEYNTEDDYNAGLTKLSTEIIAGTVPDILDVSSLPVKQYAAKGLLEDLYPYIDNDPDLSREDFIQSVFKALEMDEKLYQICTSFYVYTVVGNPEVVGPEPGWNMDEFNAVLKANPQATSPFGGYFTKDDFLYYAMVMGMDQYVDWSTGKCSFDSGEFAKILEFANTFPKEYNYDEDTYVSEAELIQTGQQIVQTMNMSDFQYIQMYKALFGDIVFKGFPNEARINAVAGTGTGLAMTTSCKDKDGAWQFMRTLLTQKWQEKNSSWNYPTNKAAFDAMLEKAMTPQYETDPETGEPLLDPETGEPIEMSQGGWGMDGFSIDIYALKQEEADQILELIDSINGTMGYDEKMMDIIKEEASTFFAGQRSAQDTAAIIQNRVSIYVAEQS